ncbi:helix-turn-helix transcriptional regulator [Stenomitos frigidus]|uniref:helix-turn-helix transcriptional regulator n=1 Tax=Stenomitos frigidus TaxID=1886765 RepID=UPI0011B1C918|nr:helix-turn-helix transcriptional regulator [Stenomitos frigidus]
MLRSSEASHSDLTQGRSTRRGGIDHDAIEQTYHLSGDAMLTRDYEVPNCLPYNSLSHSRDISPTASLMAAPVRDLNSALESSSLLSALVEALPKGVIVLSIDRAIFYWNQNARRLCQKLSSTQRYGTTLPTIVNELFGQVVETGAASEPVLLEYETTDCCSFRLTACWLAADISNEVNLALTQQAYVLITIEDRDEVLRQDIRIEQKKFQLTNREAEVWLLLKREYSYQAIATTLHISLNTVKTHIRNIHAKRHPYQSLPA